MEGLEWVMNYYTKGCVDWRWHYKYNYQTLFKDLVRFIPKWDSVMIPPNDHKSVTPEVQLSYVLPRESLHLIPNGIGKILLKEKSDNYAESYKLIWAFCKFIWESHLELPPIDIIELEECILKNLNNNLY